MMTFKRVTIGVPFAPTDADDVARLSGQARQLARITWSVVAALALALLLASIPQYIGLVGVVTEQERSVGVLLGSPLLFSPSPKFEFWTDVAYNLLSFFASLLCLALAALIFHRKSDERMAFLVSLTLLIFGVVMTGPSEMLVGQRIAGESIALFGQMLLWAFVLFLFYIFPDGRFVPPWTRWLSILLIPWALALALYQPYSLNSTNFIGFMLLYTLPSLTAPLAQIYRYWRVSNLVRRQQTKWVVLGFSAWIFAGTALTTVLVSLAAQFVSGSDATVTAWSSLLVFAGRLVWPLSLSFLPLSLTIAILRYRLFEIDVILNRALVYGSLTAFVIAAYVLTVGAFGAIFQSHATLAPLLVATVMVALLVSPLHARLQRSADRWIHSPTRDGEKRENARPPVDDMPKVDHARWLRFAQGAWFIAFAFALLVLGVALPRYIRLFASSEIQPVAAPPIFVVFTHAVLALASIGTVVLCIVLAALLFGRKRDETMALLTSFFLLAYGIAWGGALELALGATESPERRILSSTLGSTLTLTLTLLLLFLFPNGHFVPRWTRWVVLATVPLLPVIFILPYISQISDSSLTLAIEMIPLVSVVLGLAAQVHRYRRVSSSAERQQTKWFLFGLFLAVGLAVLASLAYPIILDTPLNVPLPWWAPLAQLSWILAIAIAPLSLTMAVMRYRLWDIDVILNRTLVYVSLTAAVIGIFILIAALLGALFQTSGNLVISLLATAAIAILFQPLRERLQRAVNHLTYGERDDPYAVIARLGQRLETTLAPDAVLPTIVETIAATLKLPYAAISLRDDSNTASIVAAYGQATTALERFPLVYQHESIGELIAARRVGDGALSPADRNLLETLANQSAVAAHAVRLTSALQHSRERLVTAREEERRRIRRDLHDGLGPALASITLKLDATRNLLPPNAEPSAQLLKELKTQTQNAIADIRRLVYDLRPPALDELGLVGALREYASRSRSDELDIALAVPALLPPLSAAAEVAAYRIITEAITNAQRHAHARHCHVSLVVNGDLQLEIQDDGAGLPETFHAGVGLSSMRERAAELGGTYVIENASGGGTRVAARLPIARDL